ncbi:DnaD domain-containing protein [Staphylococcus chromogenes]|uniref:DnaD domain-containing protein n=1 Tax=Staphylococcus chromogenes TaxID=46126 RepID=UPI000D046FAB|nr:DnaD domain protein [Staphylococcus chromogenes]
MNNRDYISSIITQFSGQNNVIPIPVVYIKITEDYPSAALLNQMVYWSDRTTRHDGYFYKSYNEWFEELHLTEYQVRRATKKLKSFGFVETALKKANGAPTLHYKVDTKAISEWILKKLQNGNLTNSIINTKQTQESLTEITTEITTKNTDKENHHHYIENNNIYSSAGDVSTNTLKGGGVSNPFTFFQENGFGVINGYIAQDIDEWRNDFKEHGDDMLVMAMKIAVDNNKATWSYTKSILKRWLNANITTPNDVKADEKANETKKKYKDPDKMTHEERKIAMQDPAYWD